MFEKRTEVDVNKGDTYTYDEAVELAGHGRYNYFLLAVCSIIANAFALDMFGYATVVAAASCDLQMGFQEIGLLASAPFGGVIFALPWGYYADTSGRRRALLLSTAVGSFFGVVSSFSPSWQFMVVVKLIGSSFSTASFTISMTILGECTGAKHRSQFLLIMNAFNLASEVVSFGLAYFILPLEFNVPLPWFGMTYRPWRLYTLVLALPLGIGALFMYFLHESPKYLANRGEYIKALDVLGQIYETNGGKKDEYPVKHIVITNSEDKRDKSFWKSLLEHTVPIFKPPLLWRTVQLFVLISLCCTINNVFAMWFPTMVNLFFNSFNEEERISQNFCERMYNKDTGSVDTIFDAHSCDDTISMKTIYSGIACGFFFFIANLVVSRVASRPRLVLIGTLAVSAISASLVNLREPVSNMVFFTLVQSPAVGIGCVGFFFVNLYPTSLRGMVTSLGLMAARLMALMGVNLIGIVITSHCETTFYFMASLGFFGVVVAMFLPSDRK